MNSFQPSRTRGILYRRADPNSDNAALCALARRCPQGERFRFYHERSDYLERCYHQDAAEVLVIEKDGSLVAAGALARKRLWFGGNWQPAAYLFDLMVEPEHRGQGLARGLLDALRATWHAEPTGPRCFYSYILADNHASKQLYEHAGFTAHSRSLLFHALVPRWIRRAPPPGFHWCEPISVARTAGVDRALQDQYDFVDTTAGHEGLFSVEWQGTRAWAALHRCGPKVFLGVPWYCKVLSYVLPFVPRAGRTVRAWSLHHLAAAGPEPREALRILVQSIAWAASEESVDALLLPLFENDPITDVLRSLTLTRWGLTPGKTLLYLGGDAAAEVLATERPLLMSGRDA